MTNMIRFLKKKWRSYFKWNETKIFRWSFDEKINWL